jgi:hypothetical protein
MALATLPQAEQIACFLHHYAHAQSNHKLSSVFSVV